MLDLAIGDEPMLSSPDHDAENARLLIAGRLVRAVAHNLRQPLMSLEMNLATILKLTNRAPIDTEQIAAAIEDARLAGRRMAMSLQALEDLAAPRRRRDEPIDIGEVVRDLATLVGTNAKTSRILVESDIQADLPPIVGDAAMVREALLSLILSAVDHVVIKATTDTRKLSPVVIIARREPPNQVAVTVEHARVADHDDGGEEELSWDTAIARAAVTLHRGSLAVEADAATSRAITRWPINAA
jgi:two-component system sensor kinase FixL